MQGKFLPDVTFKVREDGDWSDYTTEDYFRGGRSVLFSLPGAFTPTCTSYQLPGFDRMYDEFKEQGVDNIYCMSVNDSFVMNAWSKELAVGNGQGGGVFSLVSFSICFSFSVIRSFRPIISFFRVSILFIYCSSCRLTCSHISVTYDHVVIIPIKCFLHYVSG